MKLTPKQELFISEYLIDSNATRAAIAAGYNENTATVIGYENLRKPHIKSEIDKRFEQMTKNAGVTAEKVIKELADIAFDDISNYLSYTQNTDGSLSVSFKDSQTINTKNISEVSVGKDGQFRFKLYCKDNALIQLGKHLKLFTEKQEVEHSGETTVNNKIDLTGFTTEQLKDMLK